MRAWAYVSAGLVLVALASMLVGIMRGAWEHPLPYGPNGSQYGLMIGWSALFLAIAAASKVEG